MKAYRTIPLAILVTAFFAAPSMAHQGHDHHGHDHHAHSSEQDKNAHNGIFEDAAVKDRNLSDWYGDWQSAYPYLQNGSLDAVMKHKSEIKKDKTAEQYKQYYEKGYMTDVDRIVINGDAFTFYQSGTPYKGSYKYDGYKILNYDSGKKGVRYLFSLSKGDAKAPKFIQFSDHTIAPKKVAHFHLYMGNEGHEKLSKELTNWPTYFPSKWNKEEIVHDLMHH